MMYFLICAQCYPHKLCITMNGVCMHPMGNMKGGCWYLLGRYKRIQISHLMRFLEVAHKVIHNMQKRGHFPIRNANLSAPIAARIMMDSYLP